MVAFRSCARLFKWAILPFIFTVRIYCFTLISLIIITFILWIRIVERYTSDNSIKTRYILSQRIVSVKSLEIEIIFLFRCSDDQHFIGVTGNLGFWRSRKDNCRSARLLKLYNTKIDLWISLTWELQCSWVVDVWFQSLFSNFCHRRILLSAHSA